MPVRLSGVFLDAAGSEKGLTVLRVLPNAAPTDEWTSSMSVVPQPVFCPQQGEVGILDPFWWQSLAQADANAETPAAFTGGAMTCLFTLAKDVESDDSRWLKGQARIASPGDYIDRPVRLPEGAEIGAIVNEINHVSLNGRSIYPLLKLRRSKTDMSMQVGIRNGAMVFAQNGAMIGVIVATFGGGEFYSIAPIEDIMEWHALSFFTKPPQDRLQTKKKRIEVREFERQIRGSEELIRMIGS